MHAAVRHDYTPLSDRMNALLGLRVVMAGFVLVWAWVRPMSAPSRSMRSRR